MGKSKVYSVCLSEKELLQFKEHLLLRTKMGKKTSVSGLLREAVELRFAVMSDVVLKKRRFMEELRRLDRWYASEDLRIQTEISIWNEK